MVEAVRILFLNLENFVEFEKESQNYLVRLPILHCGIAIEHRDFMHQRSIKSKGRDAADAEALAIVKEFRPQLIVYPHTWRYGDLSPSFFAAARAEGAKVLSCIWDSYTVPTLGELRLFDCSDSLLVADSINAYLRWRTLSLLTGGPSIGLCIGMYYFPPEPSEPKRRDVTILGSLFGERLALAKSLRDGLRRHGIALHMVGGMYNEEHKELGYRETWLDWSEYGRVIRESRICINSQNAPDRMQIKGKIFEIIGRGTLCLSDDNPESRRMFPPNVFSLFGSHEECLELVLKFLQDEQGRIEAEMAASRWMAQHFDAGAFYRGLLRFIIFGEGAIPSHAFLDREFDTIASGRHRMLPAIVDVVSAQIELLSRDGSFFTAVQET